MKAIVPTQTFDAYPNGQKRSFVEGEETEVAATFADALVEQGLAREAGARASRKAARAEPASIPPTKAPSEEE